MTNNAVVATGLGKRYSRPVAGNPRARETFWALQDVNFTIPEGEVTGIIGRNGAGKSTLLKLLSRITSPTAGQIRLHGRVGSLLEVGTGFHPEMSGRENVFMNGAILGMRSAEIRRKFDAIVDFSGIEPFIDMPVKHYSSGMYTRLAFAVAAHLEPEILIVDEVLAVGDADFQKKCLGKMEDVSRAGRTVLFVSHNMSAVRQLCRNVLWLDGGRLRADSKDVDEMIRTYLFGQGDAPRSEWLVPPDAPLENSYFTLHRFAIVHADGSAVRSSEPNDETLRVEIEVTIHKLHPALNFGYVVFDSEGREIYWTVTTDTAEPDWPRLRAGRVKLQSNFPTRLLNEGIYRLDLFASLHAQSYLSEPGKTLHSVMLRIEGGLSDSLYWRNIRPGVIAPVIPWHVV